MIRRFIPLLMLLPLAFSGCSPAIYRAAKKGRINKMQALLDKGVDPNKKYWDSQWKPVSYAAKYGQVESVKFLLDKGVDVNSKSRCDSTPLAAVVRTNIPRMHRPEGRRRRMQVLKLLIERGANVNAGDCGLRTPLHYAISNSYEEGIEFIKLLVEAGADIELKDKKGRSALYWARSKKPAIAAYLQEELKKQKGTKKRKAKAQLLDSKMPAIRSYTQAGDKARKAGNKPEALKNYLAALGAMPAGIEMERRLRRKVIAFVKSWKPAPKVSRQARRHFNRAMGLVKMSKDASGYEKAITELEQALALAPWWAEAYFNLGLVQEKAKRFGPAIGSMRNYLFAAPHAKDAARVESKIDQLELAQEMANQQALAATKD